MSSRGCCDIELAGRASGRWTGRRDILVRSGSAAARRRRPLHPRPRPRLHRRRAAVFAFAPTARTPPRRARRGRAPRAVSRFPPPSSSVAPLGAGDRFGRRARAGRGAGGRDSVSERRSETATGRCRARRRRGGRRRRRGGVAVGVGVGVGRGRRRRAARGGRAGRGGGRRRLGSRDGSSGRRRSSARLGTGRLTRRLARPRSLPMGRRWAVDARVLDGGDERVDRVRGDLDLAQGLAHRLGSRRLDGRARAHRSRARWRRARPGTGVAARHRLRPRRPRRALPARRQWSGQAGPGREGGGVVGSAGLGELLRIKRQQRVEVHA